MSRIRSVHPGFFTDEAFVSVSPLARILLIGLGVEADDKGVFPWKPITIRMKVLPADNADVGALLAELEGVDAIRRYEIDGRSYGAIRNFRLHQRPKSPNDIHPMPPDFRKYVGLAGFNGEPLPQSFPNTSPISSQMEGRGEKGERRGVPHQGSKGSVTELDARDAFKIVGSN